MNSPLVVEQAKRLVAQAGFGGCADDTARVRFLYERIYQRPPRPEEIKLGLEFVRQAPELQTLGAETGVVGRVANNAPSSGANAVGRPGFRRAAKSEPKVRAPLKPWEEYTHALLQANEAS